jgi:hypothetical protein
VGSLAVISVSTFFVVRRIAKSPRPRVDDPRLEHLQQSVDAIAIEVERIAEAQRFTAKLLAERGDELGVVQRGAPGGALRRP